MSQQTKRHVLAAAVLFTAFFGSALRADDLSGAWTMVKYEGPASRGTGTGQLLFVGNHFDLVYTMDEGGQHWGRAHAGTYDVKGDQLTYHLTWSLEYVSNKPSVAEKPFDREARFSLSGDRLTVTFSNGSVQTFTRAR